MTLLDSMMSRDDSGRLIALGGHLVAVDEWTVVVDGEEYSSSDLAGSTELRHPRSDLVFRVGWTAASAQGHAHAVRTVTVTADRPFAVQEFITSFTTAQSADWTELRTFSEAPFGARGRVGSSSVLTGIQNPQAVVDDSTAVLRMSYRPGFSAVTSFTSTPQFFTTVELAGDTVVPVAPRSRMSSHETRPRGRFRNPSDGVELDVAEIAALRSVVRAYLSPLPERQQTILYNYWVPLPQIPQTTDDEAVWVELIENFSDLGGELLITVPLVRAPLPGVADGSVIELEPEGSVAARITARARELGVRIGYYLGVAADNLPFSNAPGLGAPLDGPDRWRKRNRDGTLIRENCLAVEEYREWMTRVALATIDRYDLAAWSWDPGPGDGRDCFAEDHGHLPGEGAHKGWLEGQRFIADLHGGAPGIHLQGFYGQKQDGTWGMRGITQHEGYWEQQAEWGAAIYPELSSERVTGNGIRLQAWWSQNFRFLPAEQNHALIGRMTATCVEDPALGAAFDEWGWRYGLLSAIAIGGSPELTTLPPREISRSIREEYRAWLAWAGEHPGPWDLDVAGGSQVEPGGVDWYLRTAGDRVWLFACNPGPRTARVSIELPDGCPALAGRVLALLTPAPAVVVATPGDAGTITLDVPPLTVLPLEAVDPAAVIPVAERGPEGSVVLPVDGWTRDGAEYPVPNPGYEPAARIRTTLALPGVVPVTKDRGQQLREAHPFFPDPFADLDAARTVLVIPVDDLQEGEQIRATVDGDPVPVHRFSYLPEHLTRFGVRPEEYRKWDLAPVVCWVDLTAHRGGAVDIELDMPPLERHRFLGPFLQAPASVTAPNAGAVVFSESLSRVVPLRRSTDGTGPRITRAELAPTELRADSTYELTVWAIGADDVFAALHVGAGNSYDQRLSPADGSPGVWQLEAKIGNRAAIILDPPHFSVWAVAGGVVSQTEHITVEWNPES